MHAAVDKGTDALVVVGGDGVITDALQALAGTEIPLGIVPAGTGNDHAREFGLPTKDPAAAADIVADGWTETIDLGRIRDRNGASKWFGTVAAAGFDSLVTDRANRMRWPRGRMRYNLAMLAELSQLRLLPFRLVLDGHREIDTNLTLAAFGNTRSYGGGMLICPDADPPTANSTSPWCTGVADPADPPLPHRLQRHSRQPRRGDHRAGDHHRRGITGHQRLRRRRLACALPARISAVRAHCDPAAPI